MSLSSPFDGSCEALCKVNVTDVVNWITSVYKPEDWHKGPDRPFVRNDPAWEDLAVRTQPVVSQVLKLFSGGIDSYRSITVVHPGDYVPPHTDTQHPGWLSRIHVPLVTNPGSFLIMDSKSYHLEVGTAYRVNVGKPHAITNKGKSTRIHLMFDVSAQ